MQSQRRCTLRLNIFFGGRRPDILRLRFRPPDDIVSDELVRYRNHNLRILFSGDFFRMGGVHLIDAFARARKHYHGISLNSLLR